MLETTGRLLGELVGHFVPHDSGVDGDPEGTDLTASGYQARADLNGRSRPAFAWSNNFGPGALNCCLGVRKGGEAVPDSRSLLEGLQSLKDGENLRIEDLLIGAQMEAAARPATVFPLPRARRPHLSGVEARTVRPNSAPGPLVSSSLQGRASLVYPDLSREGLAFTPGLQLHCLAASSTCRRPDPGGER